MKYLILIGILALVALLLILRSRGATRGSQAVDHIGGDAAYRPNHPNSQQNIGPGV